MLLPGFGRTTPASSRPVGFALSIAAVALVLYIVAVHAAFELGWGNGVDYYDSGLFALMGQGLLHGHMPYISYLEDKPPGIFLVDAGIFLLLPANPWSVHVAGFVFTLATVGVFWWAARKVAAPRVAALGTVLFAYVCALPNLTLGGNLTETYWQLPIVLATGLLLAYRDHSGPWRLAVAGLACGAAILLKPQALANLLIIAMFAALWAPGSVKFRVISAASVVVSTGALVIPVFAYFWIRAGSHVMGEWLAWNSVYAGAVSPEAWWTFVVNDSAYRQALAIAAAVWLLTALMAVPAYRRLRPGTFWLLTLTFVAGIVASLIDMHPYPHDLLLSIPGSLLLSVASIDSMRKNWTEKRLLFGAGAVLVAVPLILGATNGSASPSIFGRFSVVPARDPAGSPVMVARGSYPVLTIGGIELSMSPAKPSFRQVLGEKIDRLSPPGSCLYVFGQTAGMYFAAARRPASRFVNDDSLVGFYGGVFARGYDPASDRRELLRDLRRNHPAVIMTGGGPGGRLSLWPGFGRFLARRYVQATSYGGYALYTPRQQSS